jgi:hypothetical protein
MKFVLTTSLVVFAAAVFACSGNSDASPGAKVSGAGREVPARWDRGMNFVGFDRRAFEAGTRNGSVRAARNQLGLRTAVLVPHWFTKTGSGSNIFRTWKTPSDRGVAALARYARKRLGMKVVIKPHVNSLDESWRGRMVFPDRSEFWADYTRMMLRYADIARKTGASGLVIATELSVLRGDQPDSWRRLIRRVRNHFSGALYYAANYDALKDISNLPDWFGLLDVIGVDYYPDNSDMSPAELWRRIVELRRRFGVGVVLSEAGGSNQGDQLRRYQEVSAAMEPGQNRAWFKGIWWYDRFTFVRGGYGKTWDEFTPDARTSKWLCRQQTPLTDRDCSTLINRTW